MSESEKRGFFGRLFGRKSSAGGDAPAAPETPASDAPSLGGPDATAARAGEVGAVVDAGGPPPTPPPVDPDADRTVADDVDDAASPVAGAADDAARLDPPAETPVAAPEAVAPEPRKIGWFQRLKQGLSRSSQSIGQNISGLFTKRKLDAATLEELEDALIQADLGVEAAMAITERLGESRYQKGISEEELRGILADEVEARLKPVAVSLDLARGHRPHVVLVVGVNGSGKTTTIGKIAARLVRDGKSVMLAAGDTFRAAAIEQLKIWGERTGVPVISRPTGSDAAGLVFDALAAAREAGSDVLLIDTAGRLQNRGELMAELEKVVRVIRKQDPTAPHDVVLVLDATTGQNALQQVEIFGRVAGVTGLVMTKLDGTARGGILVAIAAKHRLPIHFIGVGEGVDDLSPFDARDFARAIAGVDD